MAKLYIGHLDYATTVEELKEAFKDYHATDAKILMTPIGYSRGFGFVDVATAEDAQKALEMDKKKIGKMEIRVQLAFPEEKREVMRKEKRIPNQRRGYGQRFGYKPKNTVRGPKKQVEKSTEPKVISETNLFVKNIPFKLTDDEFKKLFEKYDVVEATIVKRHNKKYDTYKSKGFGFVVLKTTEAQKKAIAEMNDFEVEGRKITVSAAFKKEEKKEVEKKEEKVTSQ